MCFAIRERGVFCANLLIPYSFELGIFRCFFVLVIPSRGDRRRLLISCVIYTGLGDSLGGGHHARLQRLDDVVVGNLCTVHALRTNH
jgi:hypothetical protein